MIIYKNWNIVCYITFIKEKVEYKIVLKNMRQTGAKCLSQKIFTSFKTIHKINSKIGIKFKPITRWCL